MALLSLTASYLFITSSQEIYFADMGPNPVKC